MHTMFQPFKTTACRRSAWVFSLISLKLMGSRPQETSKADACIVST